MNMFLLGRQASDGAIILLRSRFTILTGESITVSMLPKVLHVDPVERSGELESLLKRFPGDLNVVLAASKPLLDDSASHRSIYDELRGNTLWWLADLKSQTEKIKRGSIYAFYCCSLELFLDNGEDELEASLYDQLLAQILMSPDSYEQRDSDRFRQALATVKHTCNEIFRILMQESREAKERDIVNAEKNSRWYDHPGGQIGAYGYWEEVNDQPPPGIPPNLPVVQRSFSYDTAAQGRSTGEFSPIRTEFQQTTYDLSSMEVPQLDLEVPELDYSGTITLPFSKFSQHSH